MKRGAWFQRMFIISFLLVLFHQSFYLSKTLSAGDWPYFYLDAIRSFSLPYYQEYWGLGQTRLLFSGLETYVQSGAQLLSHVVSWEVSERLLWLFPFIVISFLSAHRLTRSSIGALIYSTNTYILMLVSGGQMGISMAYALAPFVVLSWLRLIDGEEQRGQSRNIAMTGIVLGVQLLFDPRIAFLTTVIACSYLLYSFFTAKTSLVASLIRGLRTIVVPGAIGLILNSFWFLPLLLFRVGPSDHGDPASFSGDALAFFSLSDFSHSISLLHPNWPENLFGKVYFLQPEFLVLPLLAFLPLVFFQNSKLDTNEKHRVIFFSVLGLLGAFLAKGVSDPFGSIYRFLYDVVPGFIMFRDPTKFLLFTSLSYAILLPLSLRFITERATAELRRLKTNITIHFVQRLVFVVFLLFWAVLLRNAFINPVGVFKTRSITESYKILADLLSEGDSFSRVLWVPTHQRFGYFSANLPALSASEFFQTSSPAAMMQALSDPDTISLLQESAVKYVIVPEDTEGEIFLSDRKYSPELFSYYKEQVASIEGLQKRLTIGQIDVYEVPDVREHIYLLRNGIPVTVNWQKKSPSHYFVSIPDGKRADVVVFSEGFSRFWKVKHGNEYFAFTPYRGKLSSFGLPKDGDVKLEFEQILSPFVQIGFIVSGVILLSVFLLLVFTRRKEMI
ncbi:MAG: hypothetical protein HYV40_04945 [Candidatus Levybacteria bacterium]|nr:hypothetical protein [Candidatus Levybacteria bacterium]